MKGVRMWRMLQLLVYGILLAFNPVNIPYRKQFKEQKPRTKVYRLVLKPPYKIP